MGSWVRRTSSRGTRCCGRSPSWRRGCPRRPAPVGATSCGCAPAAGDDRLRPEVGRLEQDGVHPDVERDRRRATHRRLAGQRHQVTEARKDSDRVRALQALRLHGGRAQRARRLEGERSGVPGPVPQQIGKGIGAATAVQVLGLPEAQGAGQSAGLRRQAPSGPPRPAAARLRHPDAAQQLAPGTHRDGEPRTQLVGARQGLRLVAGPQPPEEAGVAVVALPDVADAPAQDGLPRAQRRRRRGSSAAHSRSVGRRQAAVSSRSALSAAFIRPHQSKVAHMWPADEASGSRPGGG